MPAALPDALPPWTQRLLRLAKVDFAPAHQQPTAARLVAATAVSLAGSLAGDAALAALAVAVFPGTRNYPHFQFHDYARLTIVGVLIACAAWPVVTRVSSAPRWLFARLAVLVTLVLWLPDLYILYRGQPARAVGVLMVMHLVIALVTYHALVRIAAVRSPAAPVPAAPPWPDASQGSRTGRHAR